MEVFYSDQYTIPLPVGHRFPMTKYRLLRDFLLSENILLAGELHSSPLASPELLHLAHTRDYVDAMRTGTAPVEMMKKIGFPWSIDLYNRSCAAVGGALAAAQSALQFRISGNLAGGTHHSHADSGEGFCVFNDIAVVARWLRKQRLARRIAIIDLDVHQGNGNSSILKNDPDLFIFSMHGERNYPFVKIPSHLDIALPNGADDDLFLANLKVGLEQIEHFDPDFVFYQMGVDPLKEDKLGKMNLTHLGLIERDRMVLEFCEESNIPVSLALGGGYADPIELSVQAYANTYRVAKKIYSI